MADNTDTADVPVDPTTPLINAPLDPRITSARLAFGADITFFPNTTTIVLKNYLLDGKLIQVALYAGGRIEQRDTASHVAKISNLTIRITVNGMPFEIDQHSIPSTPNDLIYAINGSQNQVQVLQMLGRNLQGIDTIAMVHFKYFLNTGIVDTSKGQSVLHMGPSKAGYKLSVQVACLKLAVTLNATRFLTHLVKEIEYVWVAHDLSLSQLLASVQAAPYLNNLLVVWTFVTPAQNLAQKDCFINSALENLPHYRNLVRQHAARYAEGPMMPSVHSFLIRIGEIPSTAGTTLQPSGSDTSSTLMPVNLAMPSTDSGNAQEDATDKYNQALIGKQPRPHNVVQK